MGLLGLVAVAGAVHADPIKLRMATIAPQGTAWARELAAFARGVEADTGGAVTIKIYYSSVAGDELTVVDRIKRDQLDGAIGSESCILLAPSLKVARIVGLLRSREESTYMLNRLRPHSDREFLASGFVNLGEANLGPEVLFSRRPITTIDELRKTKLWIWDIDGTLRAQGGSIGLATVPLPIEQAAHAYDEGRLDGFLTVPTAALAFQWSAQARYLEDLRINYRAGCIFFSTRAFDALPLDAQQHLKTESAKLRARMDDLGKLQDDALLGGLFAKQGLRAVPVSQGLRNEFFALADEIRGRQQVVDQKLLVEVSRWLAEFRSAGAKP